MERSASAEEAVDVIADLLDKFGQGGPCSDILDKYFYHNSFLIVDAKEAWVLESAGKLWVAEKVTSKTAKQTKTFFFVATFLPKAV